MVGCSVKNCKNRSESVVGTGVKFHRFPKNEGVAKKWIKVCGAKVIPESARVCSVHFLPTCYKQNAAYYGDFSATKCRQLLPEAVPTENIFFEQVQEDITQDIVNQQDENPTVDTSSISANASSSLTSTNAGNFTLETNNDMVFAAQHQDHETISNVVIFENTNPHSMSVDAKNLVADRNVDMDSTISYQENTAITEFVISENGSQNSTRNNNENLSFDRDVDSNSLLSHQEDTVTSCSVPFEQILNLQKKIAVEKKKTLLLNKSLKRLQKQNKQEVKTEVHKILRNVFTPKQIQKLVNPQIKKVKWNVEDIASAIALKSVSAKAYKYLQRNNYPLPGLSTLRKWALHLKLTEGVLEDILLLMKHKSKLLKPYEKLLVLSFDEIYISQKGEIDAKEEEEENEEEKQGEKEEEVVGPHKTCQVGVACSLFCKWKRMVYYKYDQPLNPKIVNDIVSRLYESGYIVVAITTDLGASNAKTWDSLNIGLGDFKNCYFRHPIIDAPVYVFADPPHLLKLITNHFLDHGFLINFKYISKDILMKMLQINNKDLKVMFKVFESDLHVVRSSRQKVSTVTKIFSRTTARAISWHGQQGFLQRIYHWEECAEIFKLINDWFNIFNSKYKDDPDKKKQPYGLDLDNQNETLDNMTNFIKNVKIGSRKNLYSFQKSIILNNNALKGLLLDLKERYSSDDFHVHYLLTNKLNQDCAENLFPYLQAMGALNDHPSALNSRYRLRWYMLGKDSFAESSKVLNTEVDRDETNFIDLYDYFESHNGDSQDNAKNNTRDTAANNDDIFNNDFHNRMLVNENHCSNIYEEHDYASEYTESTNDNTDGHESDGV